MTSSKYQIDMCHGPLLGKIILFTVPLMLASILQLLFNAADLVVIGHYASHEAMAAIGATLNMNSLVINMFMGLSIGTNVIAAKNFGANDPDKMRKTVQTSMALAIYGGFLLMIVGLLVAKPLLVLMQTPDSILPKSCLYTWICFSAIPFLTLYNFGCAILRATGDTRRPFYFLVIAGVVNVLLNLFFVICCGMDVGGVALATAISHGLSAGLVVWTLMKSKDACRFVLKEIKIDASILKELLWIGIPAGIQSSCFAVSNMIIQSSINSFGTYAMAGSAAAVSLEGIVWVGTYSFHQTAISFVAQNLGGKQFLRIRRSILECWLCDIITCIVLGWGIYLVGTQMLGILNPDPEVIRQGMIRIKIMFTTYALCGFQDVLAGAMRGLGASLQSTISTLFGACFFRIWWVFCIFRYHRTLENLFLSYPISWGLIGIINLVILIIVYRKTVRTQVQNAESIAWSKKIPNWIHRGYRYLGGPK